MKKTEIMTGLLLLSLILGAVFTAGGAGVRFGCQKIQLLLTFLDNQTSIVLAVGVTTALLCSLAVSWTIRSSSRRKTTCALQRQRTSLYAPLVDVLLVDATGDFADPQFAAACATHIRASAQGVFLLGSVAANRQCHALLKLLPHRTLDSRQVQEQVLRTLLALRRDCGQSEYGMERQAWAEVVIPSQQELDSSVVTNTPSTCFAVR